MVDHIKNIFGAEGPGPIRAVDIFPELSDEFDRRIAHSEQRIKSWVIGGVLANLLVAIMAAVPMIFYMGQLSSNIETNRELVVKHEAELVARRIWTQERMIWEARMEAILAREGKELPKHSVPGQGI